jgi:polyferredoxin
MVTCTQCAACISACTEVQAPHNAPSLLQWVQDECALQVSDREHGRRPAASGSCFRGIDVRVEAGRFEPLRRQGRGEGFGGFNSLVQRAG